jgi:HPt (histidine-containing phosphotransfer) domain-containing protein
VYVDWGFLQEITDADASFQRELVREFCEQARALGERIKSAIESRDAEALHMAAHSLKGSAASVGAAHLCEAATSLDDRAREGDLQAAIEHADALFESLDGTMEEMRAWINQAA